MSIYEHHVISFGSGRVAEVGTAVATQGQAAVKAKGGRLFGVWKPLIGLRFNNIVCVTEWPDEAAAKANADTAIAGLRDIEKVQHDIWLPTLRPEPGAVARSEAGFVTHRWYDATSSASSSSRQIPGATGKAHMTARCRAFGDSRCRRRPVSFACA